MNLKRLFGASKTFAKAVLEALKAESQFSHTRRVRQARRQNSSADYQSWLREFHQKIIPEVYLEVGVYNGATLALAHNSARVVGVDPYPLIKSRLPAPTQIFDIPSDEFFEKYVLRNIAGSEADLVFIDGLHEYRQCFRDVCNAILNSKDTGVIIVHDILPVDQESASAIRKTVHWPGDVYKTIAALTDFSQELRVSLVFTYPSGLAIITNIGPLRCLLRRGKMASLDLGKYDSLQVSDYYTDYVTRLNKVTSPTEGLREAVSQILNK